MSANDPKRTQISALNESFFSSVREPAGEENKKRAPGLKHERFWIPCNLSTCTRQPQRGTHCPQIRWGRYQSKPCVISRSTTPSAAQEASVRTADSPACSPSLLERHPLQSQLADEVGQSRNEFLVHFQVERRLRELIAIAYEHAALTHQRDGGAHGVLVRSSGREETSH